jgi:prepilin signal peptidase PulO-like enzyme (type II secretory pathway)
MGGTWQSPLYGLLLAGGFFLITALIFPGGFGGGNLKLSSAIGLFLGIELCVVALEASLLIGTVFGVSYALISGKGLRIKIPFAPFLAAGLIVSYFFGRKILLYYYGQF